MKQRKSKDKRKKQQLKPKELDLKRSVHQMNKKLKDLD